MQRMSLEQSGRVSDVVPTIDIPLLADDGPNRGHLYLTQPMVMRGATSRQEALRWAMLAVRQVGRATEPGATQEYLSREGLRNYLVANANQDRYDLGEWLTGGSPLTGMDAELDAEAQGEFNRQYLNDKNSISQDDLDPLRENEDLTHFIDPFQLEIWVGYDDRYLGNMLRVKVEFGRSFRAYVFEVEDDVKSVRATMAGRPKYREDPAQTGIPETYSQTHHASGVSIGDLIEEISLYSTTASNEAGIDAYTKIIAEGARWDCVAAVGTAISDYTPFYYRPNPDVAVWHEITFMDLWGNWKAFGSKFGISDEEVIAAMQALPLSNRVRQKTSPYPRGYGYDLQRGSLTPGD